MVLWTPFKDTEICLIMISFSRLANLKADHGGKLRDLWWRLTCSLCWAMPVAGMSTDVHLERNVHHLQGMETADGTT